MADYCNVCREKGLRNTPLSHTMSGLCLFLTQFQIMYGLWPWLILELKEYMYIYFIFLF